MHHIPPFFPNFDLHIYKSFKNDWEKNLALFRDVEEFIDVQN